MYNDNNINWNDFYMYVKKLVLSSNNVKANDKDDCIQYVIEKLLARKEKIYDRNKSSLRTYFHRSVKFLIIDFLRFTTQKNRDYHKTQPIENFEEGKEKEYLIDDSSESNFNYIDCIDEVNKILKKYPLNDKEHKTIELLLIGIEIKEIIKDLKVNHVFLKRFFSKLRFFLDFNRKPTEKELQKYIKSNLTDDEKKIQQKI